MTARSPFIEDALKDPAKFEMLIAVAAGTALAYIAVQNVRYMMGTIEAASDFPTPGIEKKIKEYASEGTPKHEELEGTPVLGPFVSIWDVLSGQQSPKEELGEIAKRAKDRGWPPW